jgi:ABC-type uncharacterized transport system ATPase subunit
MSFFPGAKIGMVGPNGAGKSTILKIMAGLDTPSNGEAQLSAGYSVGILMQEPEVIMLDEPVAGMSVRERQETAALIRRISQNRSVIVIEHDMEFVKEIADRVTVMHMGKVIAEGTMETVQKNEKVIEVYIGH